jgi:hypothetical protein
MRGVKIIQLYHPGKLTATNYGRDHHPRCFTT